MYARDFRARARAALKGHWGTAIAVALVAAILAGSNPMFSVTVSSQNSYSVYLADNIDLSNYLNWQMVSLLATVLVVGSLLALVIGGCIEMGQATFNLHLMRGQRAVFPDLFSQFHRLGAGIAMVILRSVFVWLWSLLFVIPGIIATYRYAMMPFLMAEFPDLGALDAMRESKRLMQGNKWRLFCLELSFLGWSFLCMFTLGIGMLWLLPYMASARTAFYLEVTGRSHEQQQTYRSPEF